MVRPKKITIKFQSHSEDKLESFDLYSQLDSMKAEMLKLTCSELNYELKLELGSAAKFGTAAYWIYQWHSDPKKICKTGRTLSEETLACMLGGFGISGELSLAYYNKIVNEVPDLNRLTSEVLEKLLCDPVAINGKLIKYRYPKQKAKYISAALTEIPKINTRKFKSLDLRNRLMEISGIGPKTASWIVRNYTGSDQVAIIDIHLHRAGLLAGFFKSEWTPTKHYKLMEDAFLKFSQAFNLSPGGLDLLMWNHMRIRKFTPSHFNM